MPIVQERGQRRGNVGWIRRPIRSGMVRDVGWSLGANLALTATNVLTGVMTARLLGPEGRGQLAVVLLWSSLLCHLLAGGFVQAFTYHAGRNRDRTGALVKVALWYAAAQGGVLFLVAAALFPWLLGAQGAEVVRLVLLLSLTGPMVIGTGYLLGILQGHGRMRAWNLLRTLSSAVYLLGVGWLSLRGHESVAAVVLVLAIGYAMGAVGTLGVLLRSADWSQPAAWDLSRPMIDTGAKNLLGGAAWVANSRLDQVLMVWFLSPREIGCYVAAVSLAGMLSTPAQAFASVTLPRVTASGDLGAARGIIRRAIAGTLALLLPLAGLMILFAPWLLVLIYGRDFEAGTLAAQILVIGSLARGLSHILSEALRGLNQPFGPAAAETAGLFVSIVALSLLLPRWGITGAAIASVGSFVTVLGLLIWYLGRTFSKVV